MSSDYVPPSSATDRPLMAVDTARVIHQRRGKRPSQRTTETSSGSGKVDTSQTQRLIGVSRHEARELHQKFLSELRQQIENGEYHADLDVVARRVAEVLGVA